MSYLSIDTFSEAWRPLCALLASAKANLWNPIVYSTKKCICSQRLMTLTVYSLVVALSFSWFRCLIYLSRANLMLYSGKQKKTVLKF